MTYDKSVRYSALLLKNIGKNWFIFGVIGDLGLFVVIQLVS